MGRAATDIRAEAIGARTRRAVASALGPERLEALRDTGVVLVWSRLLVFVVAVVSVQIWGVATERFDDLPLTHPFGGLGDALFAPLARWDAVWYLRIAGQGYHGASQGFFPLYPDSVRVLAFGSHSAAVLLVMSYVVSLLAFGGALYLLHRLVSLELGRAHARPALLMLAFFPGAIWFGAPFTESLFLLLTIGAFYAARIGRWEAAALAAALASATRSPGVLLVVPLLVLWWVQQPRRKRNLAWIALAPAGVVAFSVWLALAHGDGLAWQHLQEKIWFHHFHPLGGIFSGTRAAWDGVRQLASGSRAHVYFTQAGGDPFPVAWHNIQDFGFLVFALVAAVGVVRRLPLAYGAYTIVSLAALLSAPADPEPLMSMARYSGVVFPLFVWLGVACATPRRRLLVLAAFAIFLAFSTARFATWHWVA